MKLLFCPECEDVRKLAYGRTTCDCGASYGWYEKDGHHASIGGKTIVIGIDNNDLVAGMMMLTAQEKLAPIIGGDNPQLDAWLFAEGYHRIKRVPNHFDKLEGKKDD